MPEKSMSQTTPPTSSGNYGKLEKRLSPDIMLESFMGEHRPPYNDNNFESWREAGPGVPDNNHIESWEYQHNEVRREDGPSLSLSHGDAGAFADQLIDPENPEGSIDETTYAHSIVRVLTGGPYTNFYMSWEMKARTMPHGSRHFVEVVDLYGRNGATELCNCYFTKADLNGSGSLRPHLQLYMGSNSSSRPIVAEIPVGIWIRVRMNYFHRTGTTRSDATLSWERCDGTEPVTESNRVSHTVDYAGLLDNPLDLPIKKVLVGPMVNCTIAYRRMAMSTRPYDAAMFDWYKARQEAE